MKIENYIESQYRILVNEITEEYKELYQAINHNKLQDIFSTLHSKLILLFKSMNSRLPTGSDWGTHFWADPSRSLIETIDIIEGLHRTLKNTPLAFTIDEYYQKVILECNKFLSASGGSEISPGMEKIELYYNIPIFSPQNSVTVVNPEVNNTFVLKHIGGGSYAQVFKYKDEYYQKTFALKRAKKDLNQKEINRFKQEFEQMKELSSPYIVEVFRYNDKVNEYIMEFMDFSLDEYVRKNNSKLNHLQRKNIGNQIIKAFSYIHSKELLHRDISPKNILLKLYDDVLVVKIADFGLVRIPDSTLTSINTEFKGYFNDPNLLVEGFDKYNILHETYALTRLLCFVMTGKTRTDKINDPNLQAFVLTGLNTEKNERFHNIEELANAFKGL
ncbi:MAG: protein kinase family protein [Clostridia bacterium]|nr:protein kinase family protein [Clostridia bacterium]